MTSIRAIGPAAAPAYRADRIAARPPDSTPTPAINPAERVDKLTRQLDASLTMRLATIRERIGSQDAAQNPGKPEPRRLDLSA